jgi:hypothetical protein
MEDEHVNFGLALLGWDSIYLSVWVHPPSSLKVQRRLVKGWADFVSIEPLRIGSVH